MDDPNDVYHGEVKMIWREGQDMPQDGTLVREENYQSYQMAEKGALVNVGQSSRGDSQKKLVLIRELVTERGRSASSQRHTTA